MNNIILIFWRFLVMICIKYSIAAVVKRGHSENFKSMLSTQGVLTTYRER